MRRLCPTQVPRARRPRPAIGPSGILVSAMAPNEPDPAGARPRPSARRLLLQADIGSGPAVLMAATTKGTGRPLTLFSPPGNSAALELPQNAALCRARPLAALPPDPAPAPSRAQGPEAGGSGPGRWRMCNTAKELIVTNYFRGPSSEAAPSFFAHGRHGAESGPGQACLLRAPFPVHRPGRRKASPTGTARRDRIVIFTWRGV